jgi:hypothetical protein
VTGYHLVMGARRKQVLFAAVFIASVVVLLVAITVSRGLTWEMCKDFGYMRWTRGKEPFKPEYMSAFLRDAPYRRRLVGKPIAVLTPLFPELHSGASYRADSYRATNLKSHLGWAYPGLTVQDYWLRGHENDFGVCIVVIGGTIKDFIWVKG